MSRADIWQGARTGLIVAFSTLPFGLLFGAVAVDGGVTPLEATIMSAAIFGGASQLVGVQLFGHHVPAWMVVLSVFAVNFRHILYSAAMAPHVAQYTFGQKVAAFFFLTDPQFAESVKRSEETGRISPVWYLSMASVVYGVWVAGSAMGAIFGKLISDPRAWAMDVLLPVYFLGLVLGFRRRANFLPVVAASAAASILAIHTVGSPWHVSIGAIAGIIVAALLPEPKTAKQEG